jgi:hypothetical protein
MTPGSTVPPAPGDASPTAGARRARRTTVIAAVGAALAGVAVAGTLAGAQEERPATRATVAQAAATTSPAKVRVLVKRGLRGRTGARGRAGAKGIKGTPGAQGQAGAPATDVARSLTINWRGRTFAGRDTATAVLPSIGRLDLSCNPDTQELKLTPSRADARTVATVNRFQSATAGHERRASSGRDPIVVPLPVNGMITAVFSVEPNGGDGGSGPAPATLTLSSEIKLNADPGDPADVNFCYVAAQALQAG